MAGRRSARGGFFSAQLARRGELRWADLQRFRPLRLELLEDRSLLSASMAVSGLTGEDPLSSASTVGPRVVSTEPVLNQGAISPISSINLTFSEPIDSSTLSRSAKVF
jgi:hypothetical protein